MSMRTATLIFTSAATLSLIGCGQSSNIPSLEEINSSPSSMGGQQVGLSPQERKTLDEIKRLEVLLEQMPESEELLINLGNLNYDISQYSSAIKYYSEVLNKSPKNTDVRTDMATAFKLMGKLEAASKVYADVLTIDPKHRNARHNLGITQYEKKDLQGAVRSFEKLVELYPDDMGGRRMLMTLYTDLGDQAQVAKQEQYFKEKNIDPATGRPVGSAPVEHDHDGDGVPDHE